MKHFLVEAVKDITIREFKKKSPKIEKTFEIDKIMQIIKNNPMKTEKVFKDDIKLINKTYDINIDLSDVEKLANQKLEKEKTKQEKRESFKEKQYQENPFPFSKRNQEILKQVKISQVLEKMGVDVNSNNHRAKCPLHNGNKETSFQWFDDTHKWSCYSRCGGGNTFTLVENYLEINNEPNRREISANWLIDTFDLKIKTPAKGQYKINEASDILKNKMALADNFLQKQPLYYDNAELWWIWNFDKYKWEIIDEVDLSNRIYDHSGKDMISSRERTEVIYALKMTARNKAPKEPKNTWVQFHDTIVDVENKVYFEATPEYFMTNPIPWKIGESSETPTMDAIFEQWVGKKYVKKLKEIVCYCLITDYPIHRIFCLIGSGLNGKGKYLGLILKFVGKDNVCSTDLNNLVNSRFEQSRLYKKLVCLIGETDFGNLKASGKLKSLVGQDLIPFEFKNKKPFEDYNYAKIMIATNNLPVTNDKSIGFYRRWDITDFSHRFTEKQDILATIPDEEYENLARASVDILNDLLKKRTFDSEFPIEKRQEIYEMKSNPFQTFWDEMLEEDEEKLITKQDFKNTFNDWCVKNGFRNFSDRAIKKEMEDRAVYNQRPVAKQYNNYTKEYDEGRANCWSGIKWRVS